MNWKNMSTESVCCDVMFEAVPLQKVWDKSYIQINYKQSKDKLNISSVIYSLLWIFINFSDECWIWTLWILASSLYICHNVVWKKGSIKIIVIIAGG